MESNRNGGDKRQENNRGSKPASERSGPKRYSDARHQYLLKREERNQRIGSTPLVAQETVVPNTPNAADVKEHVSPVERPQQKEELPRQVKVEPHKGNEKTGSDSTTKPETADVRKREQTTKEKTTPNKSERGRKGVPDNTRNSNSRGESRPTEATDGRGIQKHGSRDKKKEGGDKTKESDREKEKRRDSRETRERKSPKESGGKDLKQEKVASSEVKKKEEKSKEEKEAEEAARLEKEKLEEQQREEERKRQEEEEKKRQEEERERLEAEELKSLQDYRREVQERIEVKTNLRQQNSVAAENRPDESFFSRLDSSLKKNTAFVRKLRTLTEAQKESLSKDFSSLNLSKYIGECAAAITDCKLKMSDVACAVHLCSLLHQRYADFNPALLENWQKALPSKRDEKTANPSKLRVDLRFFADLVSSRVFTEKEGLPILSTQISMLISGDKEEHNNLSIILSFCKHCGDDYAGLLPRRYRVLAEKHGIEIPRSQVLKADRQKACRNLFKDYYNSLCRHLLKDHKELKALEASNRRILHTKGELSNERKERYEAAQQAFQKLLNNTAQFSDILDEDMPQLPEDEPLKPDEMGFDIFSPMKGEYQYDGDLALFEDEETRAFYETLPDLKAVVPGILYKDSEHTVDAAAMGSPLDKDAAALEEDMKNLKVEDVEKELEEKEKEQSLTEEGDKKDEKIEDLPAEEVELLPLEVDDDETNSCMKLILDTFLQNLPNCVNRELIDKAAEEFCMNLNTKTNRKKLVRALFTVKRTRYDLLPFYARLVATLHPLMPDVSQELCSSLSGDFRWHVRKKDQINIESKLKTVRFIGELVKFNMFPKSDALHFLKMLMFDFKHHNIDMACSLLETCGRFLYRSVESHHRIKVYLEVMIRKKSALPLDSRYTTIIENAYYYCNPPEAKQVEKKVRPPMHQYIRQLLYRDLSKLTVEKVLRQVRKLNWDDADIRSYATKLLIASWNVRYNNIHCLANLLAGLAPYHEQVAINVVDGVLEDIRLGMEVNIPKYNQRRVSTITYLGELYNYRMVESSVVFKILYSLITFGVSLDDAAPSPMDPADHLFRIRLTTVLLDTCGQYFDRGSSKKKLDCFLVYFQRYYWMKKQNEFWQDPQRFPIDVDNMVKDTLETVRPKLKIAESYEEAAKAAEELDGEFRAKLAQIIPLKDSDFQDAGEGMENLPPIQESDELEEMSLSLSQLRATDEDQSTADSETEDRSGRSGSQLRSLTQEMNRDHGSQDDDEAMDSADDVDHEDDEEEEVHILTGGPKHVKCPEDDDFMTAFDKMLAESYQSRALEAAKASQVDIALPMHVRSQNKPKTNMVSGSGGSGCLLLPPSEPKEPLDSINFTVMMKKGNKSQYATLNVPKESELAAKFIQREQAERVEKEKMKRVVLDIHERQEEEDYQEMIAGMNRTPPGNINREKRVKYQHPKGAPDADAIFGSKRR